MSKDCFSADVVVGREEGLGEREGITRGAMSKEGLEMRRQPGMCKKSRVGVGQRP